MAIMRNYYFVEKGTLRLTKYTKISKRNKVCLAGNVHENKDYDDGELLITSPIVKKIKKWILTEDSIFELGTLSRDYEKFLDVSRLNIPIIENWYISEKKGGYYLIGETRNSKFVAEKIVKQTTYFLTLKSGQEVFVNWINPAIPLEEMKNKFLANCAYTEFCGICCKPRLKL